MRCQFKKNLTNYKEKQCFLKAHRLQMLHKNLKEERHQQQVEFKCPAQTRPKACAVRAAAPSRARALRTKPPAPGHIPEVVRATRGQLPVA